MYALLCGTVIYHELNWDGFVQSLKDSVVDTGGIILIIAMSGIFSYALTVEKAVSYTHLDVYKRQAMR